MSDFRSKNARFDRLVRPLFDRLYRLAYQLTGNRQSAEDILQDSLVKVFRNIEQLERIDPLEPWMLRVVHNTFVDHYRKQQRDSRYVHSSGDQHALDSMPTEAQATKSDIDRIGDLDSLLRGMSGLSADHRAAIVLHDIQGYSLEEMQTIVNAPVGTIKSRIHRARAQLREALTMEQNQ